MFSQDQPVVSILVTQDDPWLTLFQQNIEPCLTLFVVQGEEANPQSAPHLANLWVLLGAPQEAAKTAQVLLTYHPSHADRAHAIPALKMLAFAESRGGLANDLVETSRSLYDNLWGKHTPRDEIHAQQEIDAFLGCTKNAPYTSS